MGDIRFMMNKISQNDWVKSEDEACRSWFGRKYLGNGMILCGYCLENAVAFGGYFNTHICIDCKEGLNQLQNG